MYWQFSKRQKQWVKLLLQSESDYLNILEVLKQNWSIGQLEISTFQQKLVVHLNEEELQSVDEIISLIVDICDLFHQLEKESLIRAWNDLPNEDNTQRIGEKKEAAIPHFLPDIGVAAEMLKWAGKKIQLREGLKSLVQRKFRDETTHHLLYNRRIMFSGFALMIIFLFTEVYYDSLFDRRLNNFEMSMEQIHQEGRQNLDQLISRMNEIYDLNYRIANDSQQVTRLKVVGDAVDRSALQLNRKTRVLEERLEENIAILKSNDSLLRRLFPE